MSEYANVETGKPLSRAKTPSFAWVIIEDEREWNAAQTIALALPKPAQQRRRHRWLATTTALLILFVLAGGLWYQAQVGLNQIEEELRDVTAADLWQAQRNGQIHAKPLGAIGDIAASEQLTVSRVNLIDLGAEWAVVQVISHQGVLSFRQTRLYRRDARGWYTALPSAPFWGAPRTTETAHFIFHYYALDAKAVAEATARLDAVYPALLATYPPKLADNGKREVWVSPQYPSQSMGSRTSTGLEVASPAIMLAPTTLREGDILAQAVLIELLETLTLQSLEYQFPSDLDTIQEKNRVSALLAGLELWHLWHTALPLATLHKPTAQWLYSNVRGTRVMPDFDAELCPLHQLWEAAPYAIQIPLFCADPQQMARYEVGRYLPSSSPNSLAAIRFFATVTPDEPARGLVEAEQVGLALLFDYIVATYGPQSLPKLIENAAQVSSWEALIAATFGVTSLDFELGWQAYLGDHAGTKLEK